MQSVFFNQKVIQFKCYVPSNILLHCTMVGNLFLLFRFVDCLICVVFHSVFFPRSAGHEIFSNYNYFLCCRNSAHWKPSTSVSRLVLANDKIPTTSNLPNLHWINTNCFDEFLLQLFFSLVALYLCRKLVVIITSENIHSFNRFVIIFFCSLFLFNEWFDSSTFCFFYSVCLNQKIQWIRLLCWSHWSRNLHLIFAMNKMWPFLGEWN